jgi:hypothetical protein
MNVKKLIKFTKKKETNNQKRAIRRIMLGLSPVKRKV